MALKFRYHLLRQGFYGDLLLLLQDRIALFSTEAAFNIIEKELVQPLDMISSEISP